MIHTPYMETTLSNRPLSDLQRAQGVTYVQISQHGQSFQRKSLLTQACNTDVKSCSTRPLRRRHVRLKGHGKKALPLEKMTLRQTTRLSKSRWCRTRWKLRESHDNERSLDSYVWLDPVWHVKMPMTSAAGTELHRCLPELWNFRPSAPGVIWLDRKRLRAKAVCLGNNQAGCSKMAEEVIHGPQPTAGPSVQVDAAAAATPDEQTSANKPTAPVQRPARQAHALHAKVKKTRQPVERNEDVIEAERIAFERRVTSIKEGDIVMLKLPSDIIKVITVTSKGTTSIGKYGAFPTSKLIGKPFDITYEIVTPSQAQSRTATPGVDPVDSGRESEAPITNGKGKGKNGRRTVAEDVAGNELRPMKRQRMEELGASGISLKTRSG